MRLSLLFHQLSIIRFSLVYQNILNAMDRVIHNKTSLFIAHRLSTIVDAKEIFVLQEGRVLESGSHADLITKPHSLYAELWAKQNTSFNILKTSDSE